MAIHVCEDGSLYPVSEENYGISGIDYLYSEPTRAATTFSVDVTTPIPVVDYKVLLLFFQTTSGNSYIYSVMGCLHPLYFESISSSPALYILNYGGGIQTNYRRTGDYSFHFEVYRNTTPTAANIIGIR